MFWRFGFHTQSTLDVLLEKEGVTLHEVLDDEDLLQELKTPNRKLLELYARPRAPAPTRPTTRKILTSWWPRAVCRPRRGCTSVTTPENLKAMFDMIAHEPDEELPMDKKYRCVRRYPLLSKHRFARFGPLTALDRPELCLG